MYIELIIYFLILFTIVLSGLAKVRLLTYPFKILLSIILFTLISELTARFLAIKIHNSNPPYHILCIIQFAGFALIFRNLITHPFARKITSYSIPVFTLIALLNIIFLQNFFSFPSNAIMFSDIIFIIFSLVLFVQMLFESKELPLYKKSIFWFNTSVLVYSIVMPVCFGVLNYMMKHAYNSEILADFIEYFTFLFYITLGYSIIIDKRQKQQQQSDGQLEV